MIQWIVKIRIFFVKNGLSVEASEVEIGETYPIYGMITSILNETPGQVEVEINYKIKAYLSLSTEEKVEQIKQRAFDPGIFVSTVLEHGTEQTTIDCHTVVFGKED